MDERQLPAQTAGGVEYRACEWCGEAVSQLGTRAPRKYCKRSHRQRAFEARRLDALRHGQDAVVDELPPLPSEPVRTAPADLDARLDALRRPAT